MTTNCENCMNYFYDEEYEGYTCVMDLDQDDAEFFINSKSRCPYFRFGDDYTIVRKQN